jgi:hypothetical protein
MKAFNKSCLPSYASAFKDVPRYPDSVDLEPRSVKTWKVKPQIKKPLIGSCNTEVKRWQEQPTSPIFNTDETCGENLNFSVGR